MDNIKIQNIYYMLAYAFKALESNKYKKLEVEKFENIEEMYSTILAIGVSDLVKKGLGKGYVLKSDALKSPRGKIDVTSSVKRLIMLNQHLICEIDEFSENTYQNQIIKSTMKSLVKSNEVTIQGTRKSLKKLLSFFRDVDDISLSKIKWTTLRHDRNNANYKMLISLCYLIYKRNIQNENEIENGQTLIAFADTGKKHTLYEKFILGYYQRHFPMLKASSPMIEWDIFDGSDEFLPKMKTDTVLTYQNKRLIIDAKFYSQSMQKSLHKVTHHSSNLYQIFSYVKNLDTNCDGSVSGALLYAKTTEEVVPESTYQMGLNHIYVSNLDLNCDFQEIANQLDQLVSKNFGEIQKQKI